MKRAAYLLVVVGLLAMVFGVSPRAAQSAPPPPDAIQTLQALSGGRAVVDRNPETGLVRFIGADLAHPVAAQTALAAASAGDAARQFAREYAGLFGVSSPDTDLSELRSEITPDGQTFVRYQQTYQGIPVMAGELILHLDGSNRLLSMNGEALDGIQVSAQPGLDAAAAQQIAREVVAQQYGLAADGLQASQPALWVYNPRLLGDPSLPVTGLVWRMDVTAGAQDPVKELVLVDAQSGRVRLHFNQIDAVLDRTVYDKNSVPGTSLPGTLVRSEGDGPTGIADADFAYEFAGETYNFYLTSLGRDSVDGAGMGLVSTVRYCPAPYPYCPYQNAFWNGAQMVYGDSFASADDVVGHELTHGVTQYTANLFYYMQSGAINESLSDIMGEYIDQLNNTRGTDAPATKWKIGEDLPIGAIRDMSDPTLFDDPDKITSTQYDGGAYGGEGDNGGVHHNSGILNKAAFLMTDGGTFNGQMVTALGIDKSAKIIYRMQSQLLTPGSDYNDVYNLLPQACTSLVGTAGIVAADCTQVSKAVTATEMNLLPAIITAVPVSATCPAGQTKTVLFSDDLETSPANWQSSTGDWYYSPTDFNFPSSGQDALWGDDAAGASIWTAIEQKNGVALTAAGANAYYLHFAQAFDTINLNDGGVVEYTIDNGTTWLPTDALAVVNGPTGTLTGAGNPLLGRAAYTGLSHGYQNTRYTLTSLAGKTVRFRFRMGLDSNNSSLSSTAYSLGWYLDDVSIYRCAATLTNKIFAPTVMK